MPFVKCSKEGCLLTISYTCDKVTALAGLKQFTTEKKKEQNGVENKTRRILTLECFDGHRNNYPDLCEE